MRILLTAALVAAGALGAPGVASTQSWLPELVSRGDVNGNGQFGATCPCYVSDDGSRVVFATDDALVAADTDGARDVYLYDRVLGATTLLSDGTVGSDAEIHARPAEPHYPGAVVPDLSRVYFQTTESLLVDDSGTRRDVYEASASGLRLISAGSANFDASFVAASEDGSRVFFTTDGAFSGADSGSKVDVYERTSSSLALVSAGDATHDSAFAGMSADGTRVFFLTDAQVPGTGDGDADRDAYERSGGTFSLATPGTSHAVNECCDVSADGLTFFFRTSEGLAGFFADMNAEPDYYARSGGVYTLVSGGGPLNYTTGALVLWTSRDGSRRFFSTRDQLAAGDTDPHVDIYERTPSGFEQVSAGNGPFDTSIDGIAQDGSALFFHTQEAVLPSDADAAQDVYVRAGGLLELVSGGAGNFGAAFRGSSTDGNRAFFETSGPLVPDDVDAASDLYARVRGGGLELVSCGSADLEVFFGAASRSGNAVLFTTDESLVPEDTDTVRDAYLARPGATCRPGAAGVAPEILSASVRPRVFAVKRRGRAEAPARIARGTRFRYALSEPGRVLFTIERAARGRRVGGKCVKQTAKNRHRRPCTRYVRAGRFAQDGLAGANVKRFSGKIGRKSLRPARYRATLVASDADGAGAARRLRFRVVRP